MNHVVLVEEGFTPSVIHRRLSAVCGQTAPARGTVFNNIDNNNNITNIGSVKPPGSKEMAPMYNIGWKYVDLTVV